MFPPARFCLVKLNAITQKADGRISAQISEVLFGMLSLHLSGQRPGFTPLPPAQSWGCCRGSEVEERGTRPGGQIMMAMSLRFKNKRTNKQTKKLHSYNPEGALKVFLEKRPPPAGVQSAQVTPRQTADSSF